LGNTCAGPFADLHKQLATVKVPVVKAGVKEGCFGRGRPIPAPPRANYPGCCNRSAISISLAICCAGVVK